MYTDLYDNLTVNTKTAKLFGLNVAVYWAEIMHILPKVAQKGVFDENGHFTLDREYIKQRTTLSIEAQYECDDVLERVSVITRQTDDNGNIVDKNKIGLNVGQMTAYIVEDDLKNIKNITKTAEKGTKAGKQKATRAGKILAMQTYFTEGVEDQDICQSLNNLAEQYFNKFGIKSKTAATDYIKVLLGAYSDKAMTIELLNYAAMVVWSDPNGIVSAFRKNVATKAKSGPSPAVQKACQALKTDVTF